MGRWYEYARYEQSFEKNLDCVYADHLYNYDNSIVVYNVGVRLPDVMREKAAIGLALLSFPDEQPLQGKFNITFGHRKPNVSNYWIIDTDYVNYSIVYGCLNMADDEGSKRSAWILSRTRILKQSILDKIDDVIEEYFDTSKLRYTIQKREM